jgi:hypothetical protein
MTDLVHCYLVPPGRNKPKPPLIRGTPIPRNGKLFLMLTDIYAKAELECSIPIKFTMSATGKQSNIARTMLIAYLAHPTYQKGLHIAERLRDVTSEKSGLGLLFIMSGSTGPGRRKVVISRFPAEAGVLADTTARTLSVSFVERIFMKNAHSYKAVVYEDESLDTGFWVGAAIDRQFTSALDPLADYWIRRFLTSEFKTTSKAGTKRLAVAMKRALVQVKALESKEMIVSSAVLSRSLAGQMTSVRGFVEKYGLDHESATAILAALPDPALAEDKFIFDLEEFQLHVPLRSVELDNGGVLTAPSDQFDRCFSRETLASSRVKFTTVGKIVGQQLRGKLR